MRPGGERMEVGRLRAAVDSVGLPGISFWQRGVAPRPSFLP